MNPNRTGETTMRKPLMTTLAAALAVALPAVAQARPVSMSIPLKN